MMPASDSDRRFTRRSLKKWRHLYLPSAVLPAHEADCPECGLRVALPRLRQGQEAECPRCRHHLVRIENEPFRLPVACALAALLLMAVVYSQTFATVAMTGMYSRLTLPEMVYTLMTGEHGFLGLVLFTLTFGTPVLFLLLCLYVYRALIRHENPPLLLYAVRWVTRLRQWIMVDVFFISMLVAYIKMRVVAQVHFGAAFWTMPALAILLLRTSVAVPVHWVYYQMQRRTGETLYRPGRGTVCCSRCLYFRPKDEAECAVCGSELFSRRPASLAVSSAFLLAAAILYIPANTIPIMISSNPVELEISTIMSGIVYMWNKGDKLIAVIIFSASIAVPTLKILSMAVLLASARFKPLMGIEKLSLQYKITEAVGRWSMIDIFVIILMMSTFHTPIADARPGPAAPYFCLVVILTMLSAYFFDMRLLWDRQPESTGSADSPAPTRPAAMGQPEI